MSGEVAHFADVELWAGSAARTGLPDYFRRASQGNLEGSPVVIIKRPRVFFLGGVFFARAEFQFAK